MENMVQETFQFEKSSSKVRKMAQELAYDADMDLASFSMNPMEGGNVVISVVLRPKPESTPVDIYMVEAGKRMLDMLPERNARLEAEENILGAPRGFPGWGTKFFTPSLKEVAE
jgi:hypothetical protein